VKVEQTAQEPGHEQQVLAAVRQRLGAPLRLVEARLKVGDVVAQGRDALPGRRLAHQIADQQPQEKLALHRWKATGVRA